MPTYTTTADPVSGEFNIELPAALVGGEKVKVTAQKNGQTRSLNLQAPSEPYLPPSSGGNEAVISGFMFPMSSIYANTLLTGSTLIYDGNGATNETVGNTHTLTNQYFKPDELIRMFFIFKIPLSDFKNFEPSDQVFKFRQGYLQNDGTVYYETNGFWYTKQEILDYDSSQSKFLIDNNYLYVLLHSSIYFLSEYNADFNDNYAYQITYNGSEHIFKANKSYVESI